MSPHPRCRASPSTRWAIYQSFCASSSVDCRSRVRVLIFSADSPVAAARHQAVVIVPVAPPLQRCPYRLVDDGHVVRMADRAEATDAITDEILRRIVGERLDAVGHVEHGVAGIVLAAVEKAVHAPRDAEQRGKRALSRHLLLQDAR